MDIRNSLDGLKSLLGVNHDGSARKRRQEQSQPQAAVLWAAIRRR